MNRALEEGVRGQPRDGAKEAAGLECAKAPGQKQRGPGRWGRGVERFFIIIVVMYYSNSNKPDSNFPKDHNWSRVTMKFKSISSNMKLSNSESNFLSSLALLPPAYRVFNKGLLNWIEWNFRLKGALHLPFQ